MTSQSTQMSQWLTKSDYYSLSVYDSYQTRGNSLNFIIRYTSFIYSNYIVYNCFHSLSWLAWVPRNASSSRHIGCLAVNDFESLLPNKLQLIDALVIDQIFPANKFFVIIRAAYRVLATAADQSLVVVNLGVVGKP